MDGDGLARSGAAGAARGKAVRSIEAGSPASGTIIEVGDVVKRIDGHAIADVLDYMYHSYGRRPLVELRGRGGGAKLVRFRKREGEDLGLRFEEPLMDAERSCANNCIFCFIDQLPRGMRGSLYYKDDDTRLGLLHGNYVTLTNLAPGELERMVRLRVSPVNVSVHATDPALRGYMLGSPAPRGIMGELEALAAGGITINCQVVCCPGVNDGEALRRTVRDLAGLYPAVASVSVVPVGLTKHRGTLTPLRPFDACCARAVLSDMEELGETLLRELGSRLVYCADELYITAGRQLPGGAFYEGYPQLENGVGMMRLLMGQFEQACGRGALALTRGRAGERRPRRFSIATGRAAGRFINDMLAAASRRFGRVEGEVYEIRNDFFGGTVDVAGLLTGGDIIAQLRGKPLGDALLISRTMLRRGESVFLDGISLWDLEAAVGTHVRVVESDGADLLSAMLGRPGG